MKIERDPIDEALDIVEELSVMTEFPYGEQARAKLANLLLRWCKGDLRKAHWLADEGIEGMNRYPGPEVLRQLLLKKFPGPESSQDIPIERLRELLPRDVMEKIECNGGDGTNQPLALPGLPEIIKPMAWQRELNNRVSDELRRIQNGYEQEES